MTKRVVTVDRASVQTSGRVTTLRRYGLVIGALLIVGALFLTAATLRSISDFPDGLSVANRTLKSRVLARDGTVLNISLENYWNGDDVIALEDIPRFLQVSMVTSEDQRFYVHGGVDWQARLAAVWQNIKARTAVRGASTITEQVVRMLHPRARTIWSRWLEGFEAQRLEAQFSKAQILEFYFNQVPYADRRRGVVQAAALYFDRSLGTLTEAEMLSLVVLVRSPIGMDLRRDGKRARVAIEQLADRLAAQSNLTAEQQDAVAIDQLTLSPARLPLNAHYFVAHVLDTVDKSGASRAAQVRTTLDPYFQRTSQEILDTALANLKRRHVQDAALIVIDHGRNEVLSWVVSRNEVASGDVHSNRELPGYDTVLTQRQPGSAIKPFLYAMALEKGWTAATLIDDSELSESIGSGVHTFHNYSRVHYGPIRVREALGNSLNIPAVRTLKFVGGDNFLDRLHTMGVSSLRQHPDFYGDGLALGNGELSLFELAQAYTVLARQGRFLPITLLKNAPPRVESSVFTPEVASLIGNILSDADARQLEFGAGLQFPIETAIKTGTSSDYHDAWAVAFDYSHTVAVWMGNLDGKPMNGVTGAVGPAMVLRSVFSTLNRNQETHGLWLSSHLQSKSICRSSGLTSDGKCESTKEWFAPGTFSPATKKIALLRKYKLVQPTPGLLVARDPRIPPNLEALTMSLDSTAGLREVEWNIDGNAVARNATGKLTWPLVKGTHEVYARIWPEGESIAQTTDAVRFYVR